MVAQSTQSRRGYLIENGEKGSASDFGSCVEEAKMTARLAQIVYSIRKPVIAKVNGAAHADGCLLTALCDFVIASKKATR